MPTFASIWGGLMGWLSCTCFLMFLFEQAEKTRLSKRRPSVALLQDFGNTQLVDAGWFWGNYTQNSWNTLEPWIITDDFWPQSPSPGLGGCTSGCSTQRGGSRYGLASQGLTSRAPPWEFPMWLSMWLFFWLSPDTQCLYHLYHLYYCFPLSTNLYLFQCELRAVEPGDWTACSMHEFASPFRKMPLEAAAARTFWQEAMRGCGYSF